MKLRFNLMLVDHLSEMIIHNLQIPDYEFDFVPETKNGKRSSYAVSQIDFVRKCFYNYDSQAF